MLYASNDMGAANDPDIVAPILTEARELLGKGDPAQAKALLGEARELTGNDVRVLNLLALACFQLGQLEEALGLYRRVEGALPRSANAKVNLALVLIKTGRHAEAPPLLERALTIEPDHRRAWGYLGIALEQLEQYEEAERALLAGHFAAAASQLRERHALGTREASQEFSAASTRAAMPEMRYKKRTLPPQVPSGNDAPPLPTVGITQLRRFNTTLRPPEFIAQTTVAPPRDRHPPASAEPVEEIPPAVAASAPPPPAPSSSSTLHGEGTTPKPPRPIVPLLDAALAALLLPPSEASVGVHASGLVIVNLASSGITEAGFAARLDCVQAAVGTLQPHPVPHRDPRRDPLAPPPFAASPLARFVGTGQLVLRPRPGTRLMPLQMDADVAFLREALVVGFDHSLVVDLGRVKTHPGQSLSLVRFRGDGVVVLELLRSFLTFDVRADQRLTLRTDTLVGWLGLLAPEPAESWFPGAPAPEFVTFSGEGTVLFVAPPETDHEKG